MSNIVYRIWYPRKVTAGDEYPYYIAYIGRTRQNLTARLRGHVFGKPMHKPVEIDTCTKIDYTQHETVADMYVHEVILINHFKPPLKAEDKADDEITVIPWAPYEWRNGTLIYQWQEGEVGFHWKEWKNDKLVAKWQEELSYKAGGRR